MITLQELLELRTDYFKSSKIKLVRHKDSRKEYKDIIYKIAKTKFNRYLNYTDYNNDVIVDIIFLMKII